MAGTKSRQEWQAQHKHFENLYIGENMSLQDVVKAMDDRYGFKATYVLCIHGLSDNSSKIVL